MPAASDAVALAFYEIIVCLLCKCGLVVVEGEKKVSDKRKKGSKGEELLDAAAKEDIVSSENGGGVQESATCIARNGTTIKWKKLATKVLLKVKD